MALSRSARQWRELNKIDRSAKMKWLNNLSEKESIALFDQLCDFAQGLMYKPTHTNIKNKIKSLVSVHSFFNRINDLYIRSP